MYFVFLCGAPALSARNEEEPHFGHEKTNALPDVNLTNPAMSWILSFIARLTAIGGRRCRSHGGHRHCVEMVLSRKPKTEPPRQDARLECDGFHGSNRDFGIGYLAQKKPETTAVGISDVTTGLHGITTGLDKLQRGITHPDRGGMDALLSRRLVVLSTARGVGVVCVTTEEFERPQCIPAQQKHCSVHNRYVAHQAKQWCMAHNSWNVRFCAAGA